MMQKSRKKLLLLLSLTMTSLCLVLATVFIGGGSIEGFAQRAFAALEPVSLETITFDSGTVSSGTTNTTVGYTHYGSPVVCKITGNDSSQSSGVVGAVKSGSELRFYESDGVTEYLFEDIEKITFTFDSGYNSYELHGFYDSGENFDFSYSSMTTNPRSANFHDYGNVARLYGLFTNSSTIRIQKIQLLYNCVSKVQTDVEISTAPTKTSYMVGQSFDPTGMVVKNVYSNGGKVATDNYEIYPSVALTADDEYVTIFSNGFSVQQPITVSDAASHAVGTYKNSSYYIELYSDGSGVNYYGSDSCNLTWTYDGSSLKFYSTITYSFTGTIFHTNTTVTAASVNLNEDNDIYTFRTSVKTMYGTSTVTFTRQ